MSEAIEGRNPVIEALKAGRPINRILVDRKAKGAIAQILQLARGQSIPVEYVERRVLNMQSETGAHQGVIAYAAAKELCTLS